MSILNTFNKMLVLIGEYVIKMMDFSRENKHGLFSRILFGIEKEREDG